MKKISFIFAGFFVLSLLFAGCGHLDGNNPVGVTGGGANGYGAFAGGSGSGGGGSVFGAWEGDYTDNTGITWTIVITFYEGGTYQTQEFENGSLVYEESGTFSISGNNINFDPIDHSTYSVSFAFSGSNVIMTFESGLVIEFHRR